MIEIDPTAKVSALADIEDSTRGTLIKVGAGSMIDSFVKVKPAGGSGDLILGERVYVNSGCVFYTGNGITIGNNVLIAANCTFAPVNHEFADPDRPILEQGFRPSKGGIVVEDDVWIGAGVVLLDGAKVGRGSVIAAMSLIKGEIPPFSIVSGVPGKKIGVRK
ncbi:acyltransferase [Chachezhania antarctica]|uniref:acyltransferase n=1 Tax=Chachezhania antarctica TaxID=2340860 RepID=UPI000EB37D12|nr:acyltransferase [Chachezhania antarctica]|tara:strand:+ start:4128 stop:4616 length:489 start_codon:yes stop_codon:yes gene_type:complete